MLPRNSESVCRPRDSSALQKSIEPVESEKAAGENLVVRDAGFAPAFKDAIQAEALDALKLRVLQINIVDHLADFAQRLVFNREASEQRFERATLVVVRELHVEHVERNDLVVRRALRGEDEFRL